MSVNSKMAAIADKIRTLLGISGTMGLDDMSSNLGAAVNECDAQADLIARLKGAIGENVSKTANEVAEQATLIAEIKTALEGKAGGGTVLPALDNPATSADMAEGKQLIDAGGNVVTGSLPVRSGEFSKDCEGVEPYGTLLSPYCVLDSDVLLKKDTKVYVDLVSYEYGNAKPEDVAKGKTFTSESGFKVEGTAAGGGYAIKSGTTTSQTINTGLSDVEQFFLYKETVTATGLIHLHYTKSATSRMYASAWSTQNYGTKTITNATGGVSVSGGTVTISATQATQGALTSNVTYKWFAIGTE